MVGWIYLMCTLLEMITFSILMIWLSPVWLMERPVELSKKLVSRCQGEWKWIHVHEKLPRGNIRMRYHYFEIFTFQSLQNFFLLHTQSVVLPLILNYRVHVTSIIVKYLLETINLIPSMHGTVILSAINASATGFHISLSIHRSKLIHSTSKENFSSRHISNIYCESKTKAGLY